MFPGVQSKQVFDPNAGECEEKKDGFIVIGTRRKGAEVAVLNWFKTQEQAEDFGATK